MVPRRISFISSAALALTLLLPRASVAQPQGAPAATQPPLSEAVIQEARRAYDEGSAHYVAGRYGEALVAFERAYSLRPNPVVMMPILECHDRLGHVPEAIRTLEAYLRATPEVRNRALLETRLENLRRRPARVHVTTTPPGAQLTVNGQAHAGPTPTDLDLPPGHHVMVASLAGHTTETREFDTLPGTPRDETVVLERESAASSVASVPLVPSAALRPSRGPNPVVWVAAGLAGATAIAGTTFGILALSANNDYDRQPTRETRESGLRYAVLSDVGFGVAAASTVFAVVMYFVERARTPAEPHPTTMRGGATSARLHASPTGLAVSF